MKRTLQTATLLTALAALAWPAAAQDTSSGSGPADGTAVVTPDSAGSSTNEAAAPDLETWKKGRPIVIQYYRPQDKRGINVFESPKAAGVPFTDFKLDIGAAFTSQVQD